MTTRQLRAHNLHLPPNYGLPGLSFIYRNYTTDQREIVRKGNSVHPPPLPTPLSLSGPCPLTKVRCNDLRTLRPRLLASGNSFH